ncbi:unknown [Sutterella wadsworthensis CAG:135]|nr:unknown [Sutterella wadsworthensis CAG:135]
MFRGKQKSITPYLQTLAALALLCLKLLETLLSGPKASRHTNVCRLSFMKGVHCLDLFCTHERQPFIRRFGIFRPCFNGVEHRIEAGSPLRRQCLCKILRIGTVQCRNTLSEHFAHA